MELELERKKWDIIARSEEKEVHNALEMIQHLSKEIFITKSLH
jgi:hypothetical protein